MLNLKLKLKQRQENSPSRRIRTEHCNIKKPSFYANRTRQPLAQNKRIPNQIDTTLPVKKTKINKPVPLKTTKLNTQNRERQPMSALQRQAVDKIFTYKKDSSSQRYKDGRPEGKEQRIESRDIKHQSKQRVEVRQNKMQGQHRYVPQQKVGSGTFGVVHRARDRKTLQIVAIKRVFQDKKYKNRQLQILRSLNHPNVLKIRDSFFTYESENQYLNVVMDYYPLNLYQLIQKHAVKQMPRLKLKVLAFQMFRGLLYLGRSGIAHRDMKPQNVLVNDDNWKLIICDFGSAKRLQAGQPNLAYICSRCYRAPELIFGSTNYTPQIDVWSAGCILIQMLTLEPIFRAQSNIDQLVEIIKVLGTPCEAEIMEMNPDCVLQKYNFPPIAARSWEKLLKKKTYGQDFYDLLRGIMCYSPKRRLTPLGVLQHPFFDELREEKIYTNLRRHYKIPELFAEGQGKVPQWWKGQQ